MTIETVLDAVVALVREADPAATVGLPNPGSAGLSVWPWRYARLPMISGPPSRGGQPATPRPVACDVSLLVLPRSPSSRIDVAALDRVLALIDASPVLRSGNGTIQLMVGSGLAPADLAALFHAAGIPMSLCLETVARTTT